MTSSKQPYTTSAVANSKAEKNVAPDGQVDVSAPYSGDLANKSVTTSDTAKYSSIENNWKIFLNPIWLP